MACLILKVMDLVDLGCKMNLSVQKQHIYGGRVDHKHI